MKKYKIMYWVPATLIFLFEGVMPAFTFNSEMAKQGMTHLGYPIYFGNILVVFKILGSLGLMLPFVKGRAKEWVFAGFAFDFIFAFLSIGIVDGFGAITLLPLICLVVLGIAYYAYQKMNSEVAQAPQA